MFAFTKKLLTTYESVKIFRKAGKESRKIAEFVNPLIDVATAAYMIAYRYHPTGWDLNNPSLTKYVGYLVGLFSIARNKLTDSDDEQVTWILCFTAFNELATFIDGHKQALDHLDRSLQDGSAIGLPFLDETPEVPSYFEGYDLAELHLNEYFRKVESNEPATENGKKLFELVNFFMASRPDDLAVFIEGWEAGSSGSSNNHTPSN